jgi:hypothetical protein
VALPRRRSFPRVLTASAARYEASRTASSRRRELPWQKRALEYFESLGEIRYASHFYSRMLSRIRIYPGTVQSDGQIEPIEDGLPVEELERIQDPGGGRSQIQGNYGRLMFITGEGVLFAANPQTEQEVWRFLWTEEIKVDDRGRTLRVNSKGEEIEEGIAYRMWKPSPRFSDEPDAPLRAVGDICEELILLTKAVQATAVTRLTNGLLLMPQEISPGAAEAIGDEDPENNPFIADLIDHFTGQIENPGTAEARVPPLIEGSYEYLDRIRWIEMHDSKTDYLERDLREEAIKRLAIGLDFPPEVLLGMTDANHWTARQVVHDMWRAHGAPIADQFCSDLAEAYLRPALRDAGYPAWDKVIVAHDDADVVVAPDQSEDADNAFDRGAVSYTGYRKLKGIPEALKPSKDEHDEWLAWKLRDPMLLDGEGPQVAPLRGPMPGPPNAANPTEGPPSPGNRNVSRPEAAAKILGAAELSLWRCREIAGARIRSFKQSCPDCFEKVDGKPNTVVAATLGPAALTEMEVPAPMKLVSGGTEAFKSICKNWGLPETQASALAEMIEVYAARTLFEASPAPLSSGFVAHVERVLDVSDAVQD